MIRRNSNENITSIYKHFTISYPQILHNMVDKSVKIANGKRAYLCKVFNCDQNDVDRLRASFFVDRTAFVEYIRSVANGHTPPEWATGCFYNGEIQILVNINNSKSVEEKTKTLTHEMVHLFFQQLIYERYNIDRIVWLDEAFATYLDNTDKISTKEINALIQKLSSASDNFDMNVLNDPKKIRTDDYDGYDMFDLIGDLIADFNHLCCITD